MRRLVVPVLVLALLAATTTAFALTEALKLERSPVRHPRFDAALSPSCACPRDTARLRFRLRKADAIDAVIVDSEGHDVRTLARGNRRPVGRTVLRWDGRDDAGAIVPDGEYRLRLRFAKADRTILIPDIIEVDTHRPALELLSLAPRELEPDRHEVTIKLRLSEQARVLVLADGELVLSGALSDRGTTTLAWDASALSPGRHLVTLQGQDLAGNLSAPTEGVTVTVRAGA